MFSLFRSPASLIERQKFSNCHGMNWKYSFLTRDKWSPIGYKTITKPIMSSSLSVQITSEVYPAHTTHEDCVEKFKKRKLH
jgi:hypothetical protein